MLKLLFNGYICVCGNNADVALSGIEHNGSFAVLHVKRGEVDRAPVNSRGSTRFKAHKLKSERAERVRKAVCGQRAVGAAVVNDVADEYLTFKISSRADYSRLAQKDLAKAVKLYRVAADAGNRYAQFMLGRCYEGGIGVPQDKYEAIKWYRKAAAGGFKYAGTKAENLRKELESVVL